MAKKKEREIELPGASDLAKEKILVDYLKSINMKAKLTLSKSASGVYKQFYRDIFQEYQFEISNGIGPFITRLMVTCLKLAIVFHVADETTKGLGIIKEGAITQAMEVTRDLTKFVRSVMMDIALNDYQQKRRAVIQFFISHSGWRSKSEILRYMKMPTSELTSLLNSIIDEEIIEFQLDKPPMAKKDRTIYQITEEGRKSYAE
jgi:hypothetical protein